MGIPYSRQINAAFDEVTPLVAAGFRVLRTSRNISILLAAVQILNTLLLGLAVLFLVALLVTVNPELEQERRNLVTPGVKWLAQWLTDRAWLRVAVLTVVFGGAAGGYAGWYLTRAPELIEVDEEGDDANLGPDDAEGSGSQGTKEKDKKTDN